MASHAEELVRTLKDRQADYGDRGESAAELSAIDDPRVEEALIDVAPDFRTDPELADDCGVALGDLWTKGADIEVAAVSKLQPVARTIAVAVMRRWRPEWKDKHPP